MNCAGCGLPGSTVLPAPVTLFKGEETLEIVGQAKVPVRVVGLFAPSHEAIAFELLDVVIRSREQKPEGQRSERSLFVGDGSVSMVMFSEVNFRAPSLVLKSSDGYMHPHEEVVARVRSTSKTPYRLCLSFELGDM